MWKVESSCTGIRLWYFSSSSQLQARSSQGWCLHWVLGIGWLTCGRVTSVTTLTIAHDSGFGFTRANPLEDKWERYLQRSRIGRGSKMRIGPAGDSSKLLSAPDGKPSGRRDTHACRPHI